MFGAYHFPDREGPTSNELLRVLAELRQTKEATVRQQAQGVYKKAGIGGRADLTAFFLEDLLSPPITHK